MTREERWQLGGWVLFVACAFCFIATSLVNRDPLSLIGSIIFLLACIVFLVPLIWPGEPPNNGQENDTPPEPNPDGRVP